MRRKIMCNHLLAHAKVYQEKSQQRKVCEIVTRMACKRGGKYMEVTYMDRQTKDRHTERLIDSTGMTDRWIDRTQTYTY